MAIKINELDKLYRNYGFEKLSSGNSDVLVYTYSAGYYENADIVPLNEVSETVVRNVLEDFRKGGFACQIRNFPSLNIARETLFRGFFEVDVAITRGRAEYNRFIHKISQGISGDYEYISGEFMSSDVVNVNGDANIIEFAKKTLQENSFPTLFLIEAAAGYGKTCTAFEIFNIVLQGSQKKIPVLTELSRNRQAKIFRYVLLDEIDHLFPKLSYSLVSSEISSGRIVLIIDGFDELLHQSLEDYEDYEEAEPMLETIGELLQGQAFVVLTSRRTSLFAGDKFDHWVSENQKHFRVIRIRLNRPSVIDWIGSDRVSQLNQLDFPIKSLSNPVLLSFIRGLDDSLFEQICSNSDSLVDQYFQAMLDREVERQNLNMEAREQKKIFRDLAQDMLEQDFTSDSSEYVQLRIIEKNQELLSRVRERYSLADRPSTEDLAKKLVSHALMDRKKDDISVGLLLLWNVMN